MKNQFSNSTLLLVGLLVFSSCSITRFYTINTIEPAPVFLDSTFTKIGVIDRSEIDPKKKTLDAINKVLSAEGKNFDKKAAYASTTAMKDELLKNKRFDYIIKIDSTDLKTTRMSEFPAPIPWEKLQKIGTENDVEVVFVLSFFDTDSRINYSTQMRTIPNPVRNGIQVPEHIAKIDTKIKTGWRIYDIRTQTIRDEIVLVENTTSTGRGINPLRALKTVKKRKENVIEISRYLGIKYAQRILPQEISRMIYVRGSKNLKAAKRYINAGDWDGASELWERDVESLKSKIAGRATYNLALISEIDGNIEKAIEWANTSYHTYNNKKALNYINILKERLINQKELETQMNN
jgi:tetratricopeptide (TPR) repeat protein